MMSSGVVVLSSKDDQGVGGDQDGSLAANNESSADTDIMDSKLLQTRSDFLGAVDSSRSAKVKLAMKRQVGRRKREFFKLPDMNEMPPCSSSESAMENMSFSTSATESLDMEHLHSQVVNVEKLISNPHQKTPQDSEDASYTENIYTPLNKRMNNNRTTNEPSSMLTEEEQRHRTLSHSWIRRLCHNVQGTPTIKPSSDPPQRSNAALDALESRQLPSIAAMALLGKAMNGFKTCEFKNKGPFVVWSSREV